MKKFLFALLVVALMASSVFAWAPEKDITVIVAYKAGSGTDNTARMLAEYAAKSLGQKLIIKNIEGGSGSKGWEELAKAKPDGYTLGFVNLPTLCANIVEGTAGYKVDDFAPVCNHVNEVSIVLVAQNSQFKTLEDLVKYGKEYPGVLKAATNGEKASNHIGAELLADTAGFTYEAKHYGGTADQLRALRLGEADFSVAKEADIASMKDDVRMLAVFDATRMEKYPNVPTLGELGYYNKWYGSARAIAAPKGTPKEIIDFYQAAFFEAMNDDDYLAAAERAGITTMFMNSSDTANLISEQYEFCTNEIAKLWE